MSTLTVPVGPDDHTSGPDDAPVTLLEYGDFECPHCGRAYPLVKAIKERLGDELRFAFRNFPLTQSHPHAQHAAEAAEAAGAQGEFWKMHDKLFENQDSLEDNHLVAYADEIGIDTERFVQELEAEAYASDVSDDFRNGIRSGVNGTPTFFINGERFDGNWSDPAEFVSALRSAARTA